MIPWIISPYSFDGSVVRFEKLVERMKELNLKSVLLADRNFHAAVKFNKILRREELIPVHGLWIEDKVYVARSRKGFESLVRFYNRWDSKLEDVVVLEVENLKPIRYLTPDEKIGYKFMCVLFGNSADESQIMEGHFDEICDVVSADAYDLMVEQTLPDPTPDWKERLEGKAKSLGKVYLDRLKKELSLIEKKGFERYFWIVKEIVETARRMRIDVGPGRGSVVGSLVAYLMGITSIDPLKYDLLFERFLNEGRKEPPDIDIDIEDRFRKDLIQKLSERFFVAHVSTFGNLMERSLRREIERLMRDEPTWKKKKVFKIVEGLPHHRSVHAAGIVLSTNRMLLPLVPDEDFPIIEYDMDSLSSIGVVKIDILGLRTLSFLRDIRKEAGVEKIPDDDERTYRLISEGRTGGIFQLESFEARKLCRKIRPKNMEDLSLVLALNRPGPLKSRIDDEYVKRKMSKSFSHQYLPETFGLPIYQEQVMRIAMDLAGFSPSEADTLRKAMSKKDPEVAEPLMRKMRENLVSRGFGREEAKELVSTLYNFSSYAFNKSHSVAYSRISYWLSFFKEHFPEVFFKYLLIYNSGDPQKVFLIVQELRYMGFEVLPPDVNLSGEFPYISEKKFYLPLTVIKGVGRNLAEEIRRKAPYKSVWDFRERIRSIPMKVLENMVSAGAFDEIHGGRFEAMKAFKERKDEVFDKVHELFGNKVEKKIRKEEKWEVNLLEISSLGFPLTPSSNIVDSDLPRIVDVFSKGMVFPVVASTVVDKVISDGVSVCEIDKKLDKGVWIVVLDPSGKVLQARKKESVKKIVYELDLLGEPEEILEDGGRLEETVLKINGKRIKIHQVRPKLDTFSPKMI